MIFLSLVTIPSNLGLDKYKVSHRSWSFPCFMSFVLPFLNNKTIYFRPSKLFQNMCSGSHLNTLYLAECFAILHFATQSRILDQYEAYQTIKKLKQYQQNTSHKLKTVLKAVTKNELMSEKLFHIFRIILVLKFNKTISVHYY